MLFALYYLNFPEIITSQPFAPSLITDLIIVFAAILTGTAANNFALHNSAYAYAQRPLT